MTKKRQSLGREGERLARRFLEQRDYVIIEENYRTRLGEVDLIARQGKTLVFIEVKTRRSISHGHPFEAVTPKKQQQLSLVALEYLNRHGRENALARFDVVGVLYDSGQPRIELITNAFELAYGV